MKLPKIKLPLLIGTAAGAAVLIIVLISLLTAGSSTPQIVSVSSLEKIIQVSELSTFTAVYNGIAVVHNKDDAEKVDYYVSYDAKVNAGIDFSKVEITVDDKEKTILVRVPPVHITNVNVDIASLDFIFFNQGANTTAVTQAAFKACEEDVRAESARQDAIYELANQNAVNVLTALIRPLVEQSAADYTLTIETEGLA